MPALTTYTTAIHPDWVDYNGHLRDAFYLLIFSLEGLVTLGMSGSHKALCPDPVTA